MTFDYDPTLVVGFGTCYSAIGYGDNALIIKIKQI